MGRKRSAGFDPARGFAAVGRAEPALINLAIVGLGKWGRRHAESAIASGRFRVIRAVVRETERAAEFAAARSIALSTDISEALDDPRVEAVSLITPNSLHVPHILKAAAARKHVLAEKPFALSKAEAERAIEACDKAGVVVAVGHDNRFYPAIAELKSLVDTGALGEVIHAEANLSHDAMRHASQESGHYAFSKPEMPATPGAKSVPVPASAWRLDRAEAPAGAMTHLGVHRIDSFVQVLGRIERVYVQSSRNTLNAPWAESVAMLVKFCSGATGLIGSSLATPLNSRFQIFGSAGWAEATGPREMREYLRSSLRRVSARYHDGRLETREFEAADSVKLNFEAFADAIEGKSAYPVPSEQIIHVASVLEAAARSLETGEPITVE